MKSLDTRTTEMDAALPSYARSLYENVYRNAQSLFGRNEEAASRMAQVAVEHFYEQNEKGAWHHR
jgi:cation transport regulator ChaB